MEMPRDYRGLLLIVAGCVLVWGGIAIATFCAGGHG